MKRFLFLILACSIGSTAYAEYTYKTEDLLLMFKSCYETIYFLGNTKYKGTRKPLKEKMVANHCFCMCDKIKKYYKSELFLNKPATELYRIVSSLSSECIKELGPFWETKLKEK